MINRLRHELNLFALALGFFSRIPMPNNLTYSPELLNRASRYYTLVGWLLGALVALVFWLSTLIFDSNIAIWLAMAFSLLLTGVFHEDGLADTADGFGGAFLRSRKLEIMKDSRIGTYGAAALIMALLGKFIVLDALSDMSLNAPVAPWVLVAIVCAYPLSRALAGTLIADMPYVSDPDTSKSKPLANHQFPVDTWVLLLTALPAAALLGMPLFLGVVLILVLLRYALKWYFLRQIGGYTGDCLGAAQQISEIAIYLAILALAPVTAAHPIASLL